MQEQRLSNGARLRNGAAHQFRHARQRHHQLRQVVPEPLRALHHEHHVPRISAPRARDGAQPLDERIHVAAVPPRPERRAPRVPLHAPPRERVQRAVEEEPLAQALDAVDARVRRARRGEHRAHERRGGRGREGRVHVDAGRRGGGEERRKLREEVVPAWVGACECGDDVVYVYVHVHVHDSGGRISDIVTLL
jgi:hypothetical protein